MLNVRSGYKESTTLEFDLVFFKRFLKLATVVFPKWTSGNVLLCILLLCLGLLKEVVLVFNIGSYIPSKYYKVFGLYKSLGYQCRAIINEFIISSLIKSTVSYITSLLEIIWRANITYSLHRLYFKDAVYYNINCFGKVDNPDQRITQDVERFCYYLSTVFAPLIIAPFTIGYYLYKTVQSTTYLGPVGVISFFIVATIINKILMSPVVNLVFKKKEKEGNFRFKHMQIRMYSESAAFYKSGHIEKNKTNNQLLSLLKMSQKLVLREYPLNFFINLSDYFGSVLSYLLLAIPIFGGSFDSMSSIELSAKISSTSFVIMYLINNFTKLIDLAADVARMAGNAHRDNAFHLNTLLVNSEDNDSDRQIAVNETRRQKAVTVDNLTYGPPQCRDILCRNLKFNVELNTNILITGDSGCGKSSLLRVLANLWPSVTGKVKYHIPERPHHMLFLPQKPYFTNGSLRQQIIFPIEDVEPPVVSIDEDRIQQYLEFVGLTNILDRVGMDTETDWNWYDELSPGEMQRLSFVRLFYHQPKVAALDEATSQIGLEAEQKMYLKCKELGITLVSVGHRESLRQFHHIELHLDGKGAWTLQPITDNIYTQSDV
ncbi:ATP-binding cassette, subfamily D (ALD), member 4 [Mytilus galloprovincialis]|uniref:ATP-binding cassette, subfamily D (ALD), member 4 n=1 Tax=Mytilus galloprovincialis TaxID=29158 RepID=A0A8B6DW82_MYTGA|nr:ATP-binding cassette, subfamily D (ALD), member 4 [Mytilus galloprovincialis]